MWARTPLGAVIVAMALLVGACSADDADDPEGAAGSLEPADDLAPARIFPAAPPVPDGPLASEVAADLDSLFATISGGVDFEALARLGDAEDARVAWLLADLLRFVNAGALFEGTVASWESLTGVTIEPVLSHWNFTTDHLIAWDIPEPPGYVGWKRQLYEIIEPRWSPFFDDADATIDWRLIGWGGVRIDDRPLDQVDRVCPSGCIPALDDPALTSSSEGGWYPDDRIVFGVEIDGEAVAFPKHIMEVHEMVNMTIGGRRVAIPYCTLCGSAQAYLTDDVVEGVDLDGNATYELRTSGLLSRSNKVMFELHTMSVFDTFTGEAVTGPLREAGVVLDQVTVRTSTWAAWKAAHPDTRIVAEDGGIGRSYDLDPLRGRDDRGPIFPIGPVDPRLAAQEPVVGVIGPDGTPIAFPSRGAAETLAANDPVAVDDVRLVSDGDGFRALGPDDTELTAHEAFWFAWSQFHPQTLLWAP